MDDVLRLKRLGRPVSFPVDVVLDTDTYNEIDDQFALAYMLGSTDKLNIKAITAAPFSNLKAETPAIGMDLSYREIFNVLELLGKSELGDIVYRGSESYLPSEIEAVESPAARRIVELANERSSEDEPLYIVAIGAISNVASSILMAPSIVDRIVVVWLGGHAYEWPRNDEFNLKQDVAAARVVFDSGVPLVQLPCMGVVSSFYTTGPELEHHINGKNAFCDYMCHVTEKEALSFNQGKCWRRVIWDVTAVAWLLDEDITKSYLVPAPVCEYDNRYAFDRTRHLIRYVYWIDREKIFADLFDKISK